MLAQVTPDEFARVTSAAQRYPVVALGLMHLAQSALGEEQLFKTPGCDAPVNALLALLRSVASHHPAMGPRAVCVVESALQGMHSLQIELAKAFLNFAVELLAAGWVEEVLAMAERRARGSDPSLLRHFVFQLLLAAAPPYSQAFASRALALMAAAGVRRDSLAASAVLRGGPVGAALDEFAREVRRMEFSPPLPPEQARLIKELLM